MNHIPLAPGTGRIFLPTSHFMNWPAFGRVHDWCVSTQNLNRFTTSNSGTQAGEHFCAAHHQLPSSCLISLADRDVRENAIQPDCFINEEQISFCLLLVPFIFSGVSAALALFKPVTFFLARYCQAIADTLPPSSTVGFHNIYVTPSQSPGCSPSKHAAVCLVELLFLLPMPAVS